MHEPSEAQQAPVGCGHGFGSHTVASPWYVPPAVPQSAEVSMVQEPSEAQQAPVGCGHGFGSHTVASPWYVPPAVPQSAEVSTVHEPSVAQQAPVGVAQPTERAPMRRPHGLALGRTGDVSYTVYVPAELAPTHPTALQKRGSSKMVSRS